LTAKCAEIRGIDNPELLSLVKSQILNWSDFREDAISNSFKLQDDEKTIKKICDSFGYFDSVIESSIKNNKVIFTIKLNERYKFDKVSLEYVDQQGFRSGLSIGQVFALINVEYNSYTDSKQIAEGKERIEDFFKSKGFAFVKVGLPKIEYNKESKKISVTYRITLNGKTIVDKTVLNIKTHKNSRLIEPFIKNRIPWQDGDVYDLRKIDSLKDTLMSSGIFSSIDVILSDPVPDEKDQCICHTTATINVEEGKLKEVAAGLRYGSSEKFGILLSWSHYNVDGKGSKFSASVDVNKITRSIKLKYDMYDVFYKRQTLANKVYHKREDVDAYNVSGVGLESMVWQSCFSNCKLGAGICYEQARTKDKIEREKIFFKALGVPVGINFDTTDNYLDPQSGIRCSCIATPYFGKPCGITIITGKGAIYFPIKKNSFKNSMVISLYSKVGSILRNKKHHIPRDKFFFAGGNNSVRGYGYQMLGKINDNKKPVGGESTFELGVEPRYRVSDDVGLVAFFECGNVMSSTTPKPFSKMLCGYGAGVRYYTPLGPIRLDLALPTRIRKTKTGKRIDSRFNLYLSVGQAF
jgi:translocation and assembly module TamA